MQVWQLLCTNQVLSQCSLLACFWSSGLEQFLTFPTEATLVAHSVCHIIVFVATALLMLSLLTLNKQRA